jgi:antitoxin VapB
MALSIRNPRAEQLAREVAAETGENLTEAIIHALEVRLQQLRAIKKILDPFEEIMEISRRCSQLPDQDSRMAEEILGYDRHGVPR